MRSLSVMRQYFDPGDDEHRRSRRLAPNVVVITLTFLCAVASLARAQSPLQAMPGPQAMPGRGRAGAAPLSGGSTQSATYVYDAGSRLIAVVDPSGNAATYSYDNAGNLVGIGKPSSSVVSIFGFTPNNGPPGTPITIYGNNFSTSPGQNAVQFGTTNGPTPSSSSLTTIATVGYGDITPLTLQARYAAVAEGIAGQFYLAILVARLVGMQMSQSASQPPEPRTNDHATKQSSAKD